MPDGAEQRRLGEDEAEPLPRRQAEDGEQRERLHALLAKGARCRDAKTKRFCAGLLAHEDALWTFTRVIDVPATNNAAERALRHAVMWRKISYGTQTEHANRLVE